MPADVDTFLRQDRSDQPAVEAIAASLEARGISVWLDTWELRPGFSWQTEISKAMEPSRAVAA